MTVSVLRQRGGLSLGDGAVLTLLAMGTVVATAWAVVAAGWNEGLSISLAVAAVAVTEAALIAGSSAGRLHAVLAAPLLGVLVIVPLTLASMPADDGPATFGHVAGRYAVALTTGLVSDESWSFIVGLCAGIWILGFWSSWMAVRERQGALAVLPCYLVLASNVINAPQPTATAVPMVLAVAASLMLLTRCELAALEWRWSAQRVVALPGTRNRFTTVAIVAAGAALVIGVALPPLTSTDISGRLFHFTLNDAGHGNGTGTGSGRGVSLTPRQGTIGFSPNTIPGAALVNDPQPVFSYTSRNTNATIYMRAVTDVVFDAGNWFPADVSGVVSGVPEPPSTLVRDRNPADGGITAFVTPLQVRITIVAGGAESGSDRGLFPGEPDAVDRAAVAYGTTGTDGSLLTVDQVRYTSTNGGATISTTGTIPTATAEQLRAAGTAYPTWLAASQYLDTPVAPSDRSQLNDIRALAQRWTAGLTNAYDKARAVENALRSPPYSYTLKPPQGSRGEWPIHYFLFHGHAAYCQYFASSMALMMRLLGVPTRVVSGYGSGTIDDANSTATQILHHVTTSDAHNWVESYFPNYGWIPFEPTPSSQYGAYDPIARPSSAGSTAPTPTPTPVSPTPSASPTPAQAAAAAASAEGGGPQIPRALIETVSGISGILVLLTLFITWVTRPRNLRALWRRLGILGRLMGVRRNPSDTDIDYAHRIAAVLPPDGTTLLHRHGDHPPMGRRVRDRAVEALGQIANLSGKSEYSARGLTPKEVVRWRRAWLRIAHMVPLLLWRRLLNGRPVG